MYRVYRTDFCVNHQSNPATLLSSLISFLCFFVLQIPRIFYKFLTNFLHDRMIMSPENKVHLFPVWKFLNFSCINAVASSVPNNVE